MGQNTSGFLDVTCVTRNLDTAFVIENRYNTQYSSGWIPDLRQGIKDLNLIPRNARPFEQEISMACDMLHVTHVFVSHLSHFG